LIVIDSGGKGCEEGWKPLNWSQTGPTGQQGQIGATGPTGTMGVPGPTLFATVRADGTLLSGTATAAVHAPFPERYTVTFGRDISACAGTVTPANLIPPEVSSNLGYFSFARVTMGLDGANNPSSHDVTVDFNLVPGLAGGTPQDTHFHLIVAC
jgi:hypothetical protein